MSSPTLKQLWYTSLLWWIAFKNCLDFLQLLNLRLLIRYQLLLRNEKKEVKEQEIVSKNVSSSGRTNCSRHSKSGYRVTTIIELINNLSSKLFQY